MPSNKKKTGTLPSAAKTATHFTQQERQEVKEIVSAYASYQGALPPPGMLKQFDEVVPGSAERILTMAERDQQQNFDLNQKMIGAHRTGQWFGMAVAILGIVCGTYMAVNGAKEPAYALFFTALAPMVYAFVKYEILGKKDKK